MTGVLFRLPEFNTRHCVVASANCGNLLDAIETVLFKLPCLKLWEIATPCVARLAMTGILFRLLLFNLSLRSLRSKLWQSP